MNSTIYERPLNSLSRSDVDCNFVVHPNYQVKVLLARNAKSDLGNLY